MSFPTIAEAEAFLENVIEQRNQSPFPFLPEWEKSFRAHCLGVAEFAASIASKTAYLNSEQAYMMGLLHDCGRIKDEKAENVFHGWVGYQLMTNKGWYEIARICLTHCFYEKDFDLSIYPQSSKDLLFCKEKLSHIEYDDYDKLLQLADLLNDAGRPCTLSYRFNSLASRYRVAPPVISKYLQISENLYDYFSEKCNIGIYQLLDIKDALS